MQRGRVGLAAGFDSLISTGREMVRSKLSASHLSGSVLSAARFRGKLGAAIAVITSLIVGFLTLPNNILYFIDSKHAVRTSPGAGPKVPEYEYAYIHAGIAVITLGCLAMVVSIVLSYFAATSKRKMDNAAAGGRPRDMSKSARTVLACLAMMNVELFMSIVAGCMELLYRPLIRDEHRLHNMECAIAVFNVIIYAMYVVTMVLTSTVLKEKRDEARAVPSPENDYATASNPSGENLVHYSSRGYGSPCYSQTGAFR